MKKVSLLIIMFALLYGCGATITPPVTRTGFFESEKCDDEKLSGKFPCLNQRVLEKTEVTNGKETADYAGTPILWELSDRIGAKTINDDMIVAPTLIVFTNDRKAKKENIPWEPLLDEQREITFLPTGVYRYTLSGKTTATIQLGTSYLKKQPAGELKLDHDRYDLRKGNQEKQYGVQYFDENAYIDLAIKENGAEKSVDTFLKLSFIDKAYYGPCVQEAHQFSDKQSKLYDTSYFDSVVEPKTRK